MTACVNRKHTKKVAAVVTASLVGALSLGAAPVAAMADTGIETLASDQEDFSKGTVEWRSGKPGDKFEYTGYYTGLVPKTITTVSGQEYDLELEGTHGVDPSDHAFFYYVKVDSSKSQITQYGYNMQYKDADGNIKDLHGTPLYTRPTEPGTYAVVIYTATNNGSYVDTVADSFTITALSLEDAVIFDGDDQTDTQFDYTGENDSAQVGAWKDRISVALNGEELVKGTDYGIQIWEKGGKSKLADTDALVPGTTYIVKINGKGDYKGQKVEKEFVFGKLDLSTATFTTNILETGVDAQPSKDTVASEIIASINDIAWGDLSSTAQGDITVEFVSDPDGNQTSNNKQGSYTFKVSAKDSSKYLKGSTTVTVVYAKNIVTVDMSACGKIDGDHMLVDLSENTVNFDISKVVFKNEAGKKLKLDEDQYSVTVTKQDGSAATLDDLKTPGTYYVKVDVSYKGSKGNLNAGTAVEKVVVKYGVNDSWYSGDIFFSYDGQNVLLGTSRTYDGSNFADKMAVKVVVENATLVEGTDYTVTFEKVNEDDSRTAVEQIVDAGEYVITVKGVTFDGGAEFYFDVDKATPEILVNWDLVTDEDTNAGVFTYTGEAIIPTFTFVGVDGQPLELTADDYTVDYVYYIDADGKNATDDVTEVKAAGTYTAEIKLADTVANYAYDATALYHADNPVYVVVSTAGVFLDVPTSGQWYSQVVYDAVKLDYMNGYSGTKLFGVGDSIKRGDVACVLFNMAGGDKVYANDDFNYSNETGYQTGFTDVDGTMYYGKAIAWAHSTGIINGYGDGSFAPEAEITAEEFACMLANYAKAMGDDVNGADLAVLDAMSDGAQVSDWAKQSVAWAVENGVMGNGGFVAPKEDIARERVAAMAVNYQPDGTPDTIL